MNNKGFAVSSVLYALLLSFLLFLVVYLAQVTASTNLLSAANNDIVNGSSLVLKQVIPESCSNWFSSASDSKIRIKTRYGTGTNYLPLDGNRLNKNLKVYITTTPVVTYDDYINKLPVVISGKINEAFINKGSYSTIDDALVAKLEDLEVNENDKVSFEKYTNGNFSNKTPVDSKFHILLLIDISTQEFKIIPLVDVCGND